MNEGLFVPHCENEDCDLGCFEYKCPSCNKLSDDYDLWWDMEKDWNGGIKRIECEHCKSVL